MVQYKLLLCFIVATITFVTMTPLSQKEREEAAAALYSDSLLDGDVIEDLSRNAIPRDSNRWKNNTVPYVIDPSLKDQSTLIKDSMDYIAIATKGCVKFVKRTSQDQYIRLTKSRGCTSNIGWIKRGEQIVSLGSGCHYRGTILHELTHTLGFHHEHKRDDRDNYVIVNWENIQEGHERNFNKLLPNENRRFNAFDYDSIMIYGEKAFAKVRSRKTLYDKFRKHTLVNAYDKTKLTDSDISRIRILYGCN